jgi:hypothetical protein
MQPTRRNDTWHLVIDADKQALKDVPPFQNVGERQRLKFQSK